MIVEEKGLEYLDKKDIFSKQDYFDVLKCNGYTKTQDSFLVSFQKLVNDGLVQRVGRNIYQIARDNLFSYEYAYSDLANEVSNCINKNYKYMNYVVFETVQLNEFINHQLGRNTIFIFIDNEVINFAFNTLKDKFGNKVMLSPRVIEFNQYRSENMIILRRLVSESPQNSKNLWHITLEKMLVDIMADSLIKETFAESEYKFIYENTFNKYIIDESKMFRYAKRRNIADKIKKFIESETAIILKTEVKDDKKRKF